MTYGAGPALEPRSRPAFFFVGAQNRSFLLNDDERSRRAGKLIIDHTPMSAALAIRMGLSGAAVWLRARGGAFVTGIVVHVDGWILGLWRI